MHGILNAIDDVEGVQNTGVIFFVEDVTSLSGIVLLRNFGRIGKMSVDVSRETSVTELYNERMRVASRGRYVGNRETTELTK